jgi:hypothetical protein
MMTLTITLNGCNMGYLIFFGILSYVVYRIGKFEKPMQEEDDDYTDWSRN